MREFLGWCDDVGVRVVTLYLLSTDNLTSGDSQELAELFEIIAELADELSHERRLARPARRARPTGCRPTSPRVLAAAEARTEGQHRPAREPRRRLRRTRRDRGCDAQHRRAATTRSGGSLEELAEILTPELIGEHLYTRRPARPRPRHPHLGGAAAQRLHALAERPQRVLLRRGARPRPARGRLPARDPRLRDARHRTVRRSDACH